MGRPALRIRTRPPEVGPVRTQCFGIGVGWKLIGFRTSGAWVCSAVVGVPGLDEGLPGVAVRFVVDLLTGAGDVDGVSVAELVVGAVSAAVTGAGGGVVLDGCGAAELSRVTEGTVANLPGLLRIMRPAEAANRREAATPITAASALVLRVHGGRFSSDTSTAILHRLTEDDHEPTVTLAVHRCSRTRRRWTRALNRIYGDREAPH